MRKTRHTGNKSIRWTFWNGNTELRKEKYEINRDKQREHLQLKKKNKEKKKTNLKNTLNRLSFATS